MVIQATVLCALSKLGIQIPKGIAISSEVLFRNFLTSISFLLVQRTTFAQNDSIINFILNGDFQNETIDAPSKLL